MPDDHHDSWSYPLNSAAFRPMERPRLVVHRTIAVLGERRRATVQSSSCERCGGSLVSITFTVSGEPRTMRSCSACDHRSWLAGSDPVNLDGVLADLHEIRRTPSPSRG